MDEFKTFIRTVFIVIIDCLVSVVFRGYVFGSLCSYSSSGRSCCGGFPCRFLLSSGHLEEENTFLST